MQAWTARTLGTSTPSRSASSTTAPVMRLQVLQHRSLVVADREPGLEPPVKRHWELDPEPVGHLRALGEHRPQQIDHLGQFAELAERRPGQRGDRVERNVADQLQPDLIGKPRLDRRLEPAGYEGTLSQPAIDGVHRTTVLCLPCQSARRADVAPDRAGCARHSSGH